MRALLSTAANWELWGCPLEADLSQVDGGAE
jgi:hypothetical protein